MRYSTQPRERKYIQGYGFMSFARKPCDKYGQKLIDTALTAFTKVVQIDWEKDS